MSGMADEAARRMREDGIDTSQTPDEALSGTAAPGTGGTATPPNQVTPPAGASNTDTGTGGEPGPIPYSRFSEVNAQLREMREKYGTLEEYGIEPDSAVRLASFEAAYQQDPTGTISMLVDQLDLPDSRKSTLKELLGSEAQGATGAGQDGTNGEEEAGAQLPTEMREVVDYVRQQRTAETERESQQRLDLVVGHWRQLDEKDGISIPERQRLMYIQTAAAAGGFSSLEQLAEVARTAYLEDRDVVLGGAVQRRGTGIGLPVSRGGVPPTLPQVPKSMAEARKLIDADIAAGRFPDLTGG